MAFKMKGWGGYQKSPLEYERNPQDFAKRKAGPKNEVETGIVYRNGKKFWKAPDGSLHTGQVDDYMREKKADEQFKKKSPNKYNEDGMPVKTSGLGPRRAFGGVKNPELDPTHKKPKKRKVMKDGGSGWKNPHAVKSDFQKKVEAKKKAWANMTPAEKKAMQDAANDKADKFHKRGKYAKKK